MRIIAAMTIVSALTLVSCQSSGDDSDAVPASAVPASMDATATASNGAPMDIADLVNAPVASAKGQMQARGYRIGVEQGQTVFWWNPRTTICATTVTANGRLQTIGTASARFCGQNSN
ncbi:hypothetical protein [Phyllobacterium endophyticum]|uniref:Uncharacterized protein n=1 Tax=Phyllobacterium endophyticum TaxID=1149773 RepID=A0A2P7ALD1_9HYPH|nr:hypothetical protein [Phyllobacterium endophyticum]MBB3236471.1 hypothetical protein [Phyllobacterium endophyticum]PSH55012.1 hypothetical protein CU100_23175 [Phyllobacterium endophyticum]TYR39993.1 hypothetical protein FY050_20500 [Phyllobacterium endophyticum]